MEHDSQQPCVHPWPPNDVVRVTANLVALQVSADVDVPDGISNSELSSLITHVLDQEGATGDWGIGIRFTSDDAIQRMHSDFMGIDTPTDIMTFPYGDSDEGFPSAAEEELGGDLVISIEHARENAATAGWTDIDEVLFLVTHGVLHLLGWDDHGDAARGAMLARQLELLEAWRRNGTLP